MAPTAGRRRARRRAAGARGRPGRPTRRCRRRRPAGRGSRSWRPTPRCGRPGRRSRRCRAGPGRAQRPARPDEYPGRQRLAGRRPQSPVPGRLVEGGLGDVLAEPEVVGQPELVDTGLQVLLDLRLWGVDPAPAGVRGERERVQVRRDVAGRARVRVVAPRPADAIAPVEDDEVADPGLPEPDRHADTGETAADDRHRDVVTHRPDATHPARRGRSPARGRPGGATSGWPRSPGWPAAST
jgi:hypothetical protein